VSKNLTLRGLVDELDRIAASQCLTDSAREAARRSCDAVRALRSALALDWDSEAVDLHGIAQNVEPNDYLRRVHGIGEPA
jgi:hypothetical protein